MASVTDAEVLDWYPLVVEVAKRYTGWHGAEFDDLVQEGWIGAWLVLEKGQWPTERVVEQFVLDWVRKCERWSRGESVYTEARCSVCEGLSDVSCPCGRLVGETSRHEDTRHPDGPEPSLGDSPGRAEAFGAPVWLLGTDVRDGWETPV